MAEQIPDGKARAARIALAVLAGALGTVLIGAALWAVFRPDTAAPPQRTIEPAERTDGETTRSGESTETTGSPSNGGQSQKPGAEKGPGGKQVPGRTPRIAFRLGSSIYVAREDGAGAVAVVRSAAGPYSLSPDAETLALIEGDVLKLVDVGDRKALEVGVADEGLAPCWQADSSRLYFRRRSATGDSFEVWRVGRTGAGAERVSMGQQAAVSADGKVLVVRESEVPMPDGSSFVLVSVSGAALRPVKVDAGVPTVVATNGSLVFVGVSSGDGASAILSMKPDGRQQKAITRAVPGGTPALWARMCPSPDGQVLAVAAQGDDGFSRAFLLPVDGGSEMVGLTQRRDTYVHSWSASGKNLFFIEGNAFQGEPTALVSVRRDGSGRRTIVTGAE